MELLINFLLGNIAYILLIIAVIYFVIFGLRMSNARKNGTTFTYRMKNVIAFAIMIGIGIYCLVTGQNLTQFIG